MMVMDENGCFIRVRGPQDLQRISSEYVEVYDETSKKIMKKVDAATLKMKLGL